MNHPIDCFVPVGNASRPGSAFGANQPVALEQRLEGAIVGNAPKLEVSVVKLEGKPGRLFVLKHLRARCDQALSAYRTFFVGAYTSRVFIQPTEMNPEGVPRCDSLYTVSFYVDGDVSEISYRGDFYGDPSSTFETIWALDWTHTATLGSAIACAKGVVLPTNFMQSGQTNPLPKAKPATAPAKAGEKSVLPWVLGAAAVGGLAWWAWSSGALAGVGLAANPNERLTPDITVRGRMPTKQQYETALRLLRHVADHSPETPWKLDDEEQTILIALQQQGLVRVRMRGGRDFTWNTFHITDSGKMYLRQRTPAANPRPLQTTSLHGGEVAVEIEDRGDYRVFIFPSWTKVKAWQRYVGSHRGTDPVFWAGEFGGRGLDEPYANPGRAQKLGVHPSDVDPKELARGTKHELEHTDSRKVAARIALDHLAESPSYYRHLDAMEKKYKGNPDAGPAVHARRRELAPRQSTPPQGLSVR